MIREFVLRRAQKIAASRTPDFVIGGSDSPYLQRWWIIPRNRWFNIYLHHFLRSDDDRALHDHPWWNLSWLLEGYYFEHLPDGDVRVREAGQIVFRKASAAHRVELDFPIIEITQDSFVTGTEMPVWTIFITGPRIREWGFLCPKGWRHWTEFCAPGDSSTVGRGCE